MFQMFLHSEEKMIKNRKKVEEASCRNAPLIGKEFSII